MPETPDRSRLIAIAAVVAAIALLGGFLLWGDRGDDGGDIPADTQTSSAAPDPGGFPEAKETPDGEVPQAAIDRAREGLLAYTEYAYTDAAYDSWMKRLAKMSTDTFAALVRHRFDSPEADAEGLWKYETVPTKRESKTTVKDITLDDSGLSDNTGEFLTFLVEYETSIRSVDTDGWTTPTETLAQRVTVVEVDGTWLVNNIEATDQRVEKEAT